MQLDWVKTYSGTYSGGADGARAVTLDDSGNVYVTGYSQTNSASFKCVTIKYNKVGDTMWIRHYQPSSNTQGHDIKVDDSGSVYVSGRGIIKYDRNGNLIWESIDSTIYYKIILDSLGNIYGGGLYRSQLTAGKYAKNGNRVWRKVYSFAGSGGTDRFGDLVKDKFGNVAITGRSKSNTTFYDYATIKYSNDGNLIWSRRYNGPSSYSDDGAYGVTSDLSGNIYVTGYSMDITNSDNCLTLKYDSSGNILWIKRIQSSEHIANIGYDMATDSSQNLFIAGRLDGGTATIKLDINGNIIWSTLYPEGSIFTTNYPVIILDSAYNVYVTGTSTATGYADYAALKYDSSGNQIYLVTYNYLTIGFDYVNDLALDKKGNIYLTGEFAYNGISGSYGTVKFSPIKTGIFGNNIVPDKFKLEQNYPNPFNPSTVISYSLRIYGFVSLKVYDALGKEVTTLVNQKQSPGTYEVEFNARLHGQGSDLSSGVYYYKIESENFSEVRKMILLK
ncbi:MAG: T9SS type A sorting domain-containing protein [Bacteroidota bacterium]|nr:T9SS type A sorting domain-containing protein [Bacteroidota bacterium]